MSKKLELKQGMRFGMLTVIRLSHKNHRNNYFWLCRCDCGKEIAVIGKGLVNGDNKSCGCKHYKDITGQKFGRLTAISFYKIREKDGRALWNCECECGNKVIVEGRSLRNGSTASCGCLREGLNVKDITGRKFGKLTVISFHKIIKKQAYWLCRCDCGEEIIIKSSVLSCGQKDSCGCATKDKMSKVHLIHGQSGENKTVEYETWKSIKARCYNKNNEHYKDYGGRGITICDEWKNNFECFLKDMGMRPSPTHSIDRINNNKGYSKENCKWSTKKEQQNNRRSNRLITYDGLTLNLSQWAEKLKINYETLRNRIFVSNWSVEKSLTHPVHVNKFH